jgi:ATP/ADP translocase
VGEKIEATKWLLWAIVVFIILLIVGGISMVVSKRVEREVLVNSHQYKEGMRDRASVLRASIAEIDTRLLSTTLGEGVRNNLQAQRSALNIQLNSIRR